MKHGLTWKQFTKKVNRLNKKYDKIAIYCLHSAIDDCIYIGQTNNINRRYKEHLLDNYTFNKDTNSLVKKCIWIRSLLDLNIKPHITILEYVEPKDKYIAEKFYMEYFKSIGANVINEKPGSRLIYKRIAN